MRGRAASVLSQRVWIQLVNGLLVAALLSTLQIYLRQRLADQNPELPRLMLLNLVAWAPWLPLAAGILMVQRRFPLLPVRTSRGVLPSRGAIVHLATGLCVAVLFLSYLAVFRLISQGLPIEASSFGANFALETADFFLVCLLLYGAIVAYGSLRLEPLEAKPATTPSTTVPGTAGPPRLEVKSRGRSRYFSAPQVDWISSEGSYVRLHVGAESHLLRATMKEMEQLLAGHGFVRIHRSSIVNRSRVVARRSRPKGDAEVVLRDGTVVRMSRRYRAEL